MYCFDVARDGRRLATVGIRGKGALTVMLGGEVKNGRPTGNGWELWIGGLESSARLTRHIRWVHRPLKLGDTIVVRVVKRASADAPSVRLRVQPPKSASRASSRRRVSR
jgi:hypothetical protein